MMSESELFFMTFVPVPGYDVWIRVVFEDIFPCPWLWCLNQSCFWGHSSLPLAMMSESELFLRTFVLDPGWYVWIRVVLEDICPCPWLWCLNQSCFWGHLSLPMAMMSESEWFLRTFVPAPGYDVWISCFRTFFPVSGYDVWIRVVFEDICPCPWLWCLNQSGVWGHLSLPLAVMSESELFLKTFVPAPGYDVWIRVVFEDICPFSWLWFSESELFLRTFVPAPGCDVWISVVF
jgi:hypothetical protein